MPESAFASDFRVLLAKHGITAPRFAHGAAAFNPDKPQCLYSGPVYDEDEMVAATAALVEGRWSVAGEYVRRFERLFSDYLGQAESVMVNSGSSADLLMIAAAKEGYGWKDGDGIIVSPVGFPTTISAIVLNGLTPVFVDIEWETLNADNSLIERALQRAQQSKRLDAAEGWVPDEPIRAVFISPVLGNPPDIDKLTELAQRYGVKLLLDGCDSLGTTWRGKHLAEYAVATSCSFFPSHHISTLQGGMISSNDTELIALARRMAAWGRDCYCVGAANLLPNGTCGCRFKEWLPETCPEVVLDHKYIYTTDRAYNLQPLDIQGALGCVQMGKLERIHMARREAAARIRRSLFDQLWTTSIKIWTAPALPLANPSWFGVPIICPDYDTKRRFQAHLEAAGIQTRNYFSGNVLQHPGFAHLGRAQDYPNASEVLKRVFFIGCPPFYTEAHFNHIEQAFQSFKTS